MTSSTLSMTLLLAIALVAFAISSSASSSSLDETPSNNEELSTHQNNQGLEEQKRGQVPFRWGKRVQVPFRWGKRSSTEVQQEQKRGQVPFRWGKRAGQVPFRWGKRAQVPFRWGKRTGQVPFRWGKRSSQSRSSSESESSEEQDPEEAQSLEVKIKCSKVAMLVELILITKNTAETSNIAANLSEMLELLNLCAVLEETNSYDSDYDESGGEEMVSKRGSGGQNKRYKNVPFRWGK